MPKTPEYIPLDGNDIEDHGSQIPDSNGRTPCGSFRDYPEIRGTLTALVDSIILEGSKTSKPTGSAFDLETSFRETESLLGSVTTYLQSAVLSNQRQRASQHNTRQAINQLPAEILVMIFHMVLPLEDEDDNYYAKLSVLSSVYSRWREITKHTASLWCMINVTHSQELVDLIFHRSKDGPLDVDFDSTWLSKSAAGGYGYALFMRCLKEVHRWRTLLLSTDDTSILDRVSGLKAPRLENFQIYCFSDARSATQGELRSQTLLLPSSPALTKLDLNGITVQAGITPNILKHLSLSHMRISSSHLRYFLQANTGLQTLSVWEISVDDSTQSRSRIYLSKLQELSLCSSPKVIAELVEDIQAPNLGMLDVAFTSPLPAHAVPEEENILAGFRSFCGVPDLACLGVSFTPDGNAFVSSVGLDKHSKEEGFFGLVLNSYLRISYTARPIDITLSQLKETYKDNEMALVPVKIEVAKSEAHDDVIQSLLQLGHVRSINLSGGLIQKQFIAHLGSLLLHSSSPRLSQCAPPHPHLRTLEVSDLTVDGIRALADMVRSRTGHAASFAVKSVLEQSSRLPVRLEYVFISGMEIAAFFSSSLLDLATNLGDGVLRIAYETQDRIISNVPAPIAHGGETIMLSVSAPKEPGCPIMPTIPPGYRLASA